MLHHIVRSLTLASVAALILATGPAAAKMPYFSVEISPPDPVEGEEVTIVVRMWDDADHTLPATWWPEERIDGLIDLQGPVDDLPISLLRRDEATYDAKVTLTEGTWRLVPFARPGWTTGRVAGMEGYPSPITLTVASNMSGWTSVAIAGGLLGLTTAGVLIGRPVRRRMQLRRSVAR